MIDLYVILRTQTQRHANGFGVRRGIRRQFSDRSAVAEDTIACLVICSIFPDDFNAQGVVEAVAKVPVILKRRRLEVRWRRGGCRRRCDRRHDPVTPGHIRIFAPQPARPRWAFRRFYEPKIPGVMTANDFQRLVDLIRNDDLIRLAGTGPAIGRFAKGKQGHRICGGGHACRQADWCPRWGYRDKGLRRGHRTSRSK